MEGFFVSAFALGNLLGCLTAALTGDRLGRRWTLWTGAFISALGGILQAAAMSFAMLMVGRIISGLGNGYVGTNDQRDNRQRLIDDRAALSQRHAASSRLNRCEDLDAANFPSLLFFTTSCST